MGIWNTDPHISIYSTGMAYRLLPPLPVVSGTLRSPMIAAALASFFSVSAIDFVL